VIISYFHKSFFINITKPGGAPRCFMKVDLMKAYDSTRWDFLLAILQTFGFPSCTVNWNGECISTTRFLVSIKRELHGFFRFKIG